VDDVRLLADPEVVSGAKLVRSWRGLDIPCRHPSRQVAAEKEGPVLDLAWRHSSSGGCLADGIVKHEMLERWRSLNEPGRISFKDTAGRNIAIPLSFRGLAPALDRSPHPRAFAALALHHLVALLEQAFALTIFALLLLLDVRAFFTSHEILLP
jgi:hypothetical protein